ncbi:kinase-like protein, partial [Gonapodya prolifera JEL478]
MGDGGDEERKAEEGSTGEEIAPFSQRNTWLRRLFDSELFDSRMCLSYLANHSNDPTVLSYLALHVLNRYSAAEIEFLLPQLLHLVVSSPETYLPVEKFLISRGSTNHHLALMAFALLSCYGSDWKDTESGDNVSLVRRLSRIVLESANAVPDQGIASPVVSVKISEPPERSEDESSKPQSILVNMSQNVSGEGSRVESISIPGDDCASQLPSPVHSTARTSNASRDSATNATSPSALRPSLEALRHGTAFTSPPYGSDGNDNYFSSTLGFFSTLQEISDRLRAVDRESRQAVLQTELEMVNSNLPAEVCLPLWCSAGDHNDGDGHRHHRIMRIATSDCVVLNSADRVPFMLFLESWDSSDALSPTPSPSIANGGTIFSLPDANNSTETLESEASSDADDPGQCEECRKLGEREVRKEALESLGSSLTPTIEDSHPNVTPRDSNGEHEIEGLATRNLGPSDSITEDQTGTSSADSLNPQTSPSSANDPTLQPLCSRHARRKTRTTLKIHSKPDSNRDYCERILHRHARHMFKIAQPESSLDRMVLDRRLRYPVKASPVRPRLSSSESSTQDEVSEKMRTAAVLLAQLYQLQEQSFSMSPTGSSPRGTLKGSQDSRFSSSLNRPMNPGAVDFGSIRQKIIKEMMALDDQRRKRVEREKGDQTPVLVDEHLEEEAERKLREIGKLQVKEPSAVLLHETYASRSARIRATSPYGSDPRWRLFSVIVKSGADLRQEQLASQLVREVRDLWRKYGVACWVRYYRVLVTSEYGGLVETVPDAVSIHSLKKEAYGKRLNQQGLQYTLYDFFIKEFGQPGCESFQKAQTNFMRSLAGYSLFCYLFNVKDRHNGNIMVDRSGHIIHIDWGFMLANSPGAVEFERAPFKLLQEYVDVLGGYTSPTFQDFKQLLFDGLQALRKEPEKFLVLIDGLDRESTLSCFTGKNLKPTAFGNAPLQTPTRLPTTAVGSASLGVRARLGPQAMTDSQLRAMVDGLVDESFNNVFSRLYDSFQSFPIKILFSTLHEAMRPLLEQTSQLQRWRFASFAEVSQCRNLAWAEKRAACKAAWEYQIVRFHSDLQETSLAVLDLSFYVCIPVVAD